MWRRARSPALHPHGGRAGEPGRVVRARPPRAAPGHDEKQWLTGNIPVVYYPAKEIDKATFKVDKSYPEEAILEMALLPKDTKEAKPQVFYIGLKKAGKGTAARWMVNYWVPRAAPQIPTDRG